MKKQILNLGKGLSKSEQKLVHGGGGHQECASHSECPAGQGCCDMSFCVTDEYYGNHPFCYGSN